MEGGECQRFVPLVEGKGSAVWGRMPFVFTMNSYSPPSSKVVALGLWVPLSGGRVGLGAVSTKMGASSGISFLWPP